MTDPEEELGNCARRGDRSLDMSSALPSRDIDRRIREDEGELFEEPILSGQEEG